MSTASNGSNLDLYVLDGVEYIRRLYDYSTLVAVPAGANGQGSNNIVVQQGAPFLCHAIEIVASDDGDDLNSARKYMVQITDQQANQGFTSGPVPRANYGGPQFPRPLPQEVLFMPGAQIQATITQADTTPVAANVWVIYQGYQLYPNTILAGAASTVGR